MLLVCSKYATWQSISRFSNPVLKSYFRYTLAVPSAYYLRTFTLLLPLCSQKLSLENILPILLLILGCNIVLFHHLSSFLVITRRFSFFRIRSIRRCSPFLLAFVFFSVLVLIIHHCLIFVLLSFFLNNGRRPTRERYRQARAK